jgi:integrase
MPRLKLNDWTIRALESPARGQINYIDTTLPGFGLRLAAGGARTWTVTYHRGRYVRRLTLGRYPLVSLADARAQAKQMLAAVTQGHDPAAEKRTQRQVATFGDLVKEYIEHHAKPKKRSWQKDEYMLGRYVPVVWSSRPANEITRRDIRVHLESLAERTPAMANRVLALLRTVWNFAVARELIAVSPCSRIERPAADRTRDRVLTVDEIRQVWTALEQESSQTAALFQLYFYTAQRGGELRTMQWSDLDLDAAWWVIPAERAKNKLAHRVPLSPQAVDVLRRLGAHRADGSPWVFAAVSCSGHRTNVQRAQDTICEHSGVTNFTPHDIRRTVATFLTSELGVSRLVVSKILNHVEHGVTKVYDRASYDREKRVALERWAVRLDEIVTTGKSGTIESPLRAVG